MKKILLSSCLFVFTLLSNAQTSTLNRANEPVVLTGSQLNLFSSVSPGEIVGFKFINGNWSQIPVQADERVLLDIVTPYGAYATTSGFPPDSTNPTLSFFCDTATAVGADTAANFDSDDELVFMVSDAGAQADGSFPPGVNTGLCQEVALTDPLGGSGYVYLFQNAGSLQQDAGISYVTLTSNLAATTGFPVNINSTNNENTTITTSKYSWHMSAEWISDSFKIVAGNNTDILDRHKNYFYDGYCGRNENTFSAAENAFICVKAGPIRVIRSYMGANSGPLTQRTHLFYEGRQDISTDLRVHLIPSVYDVFDYNSAATGMVYRNNVDTIAITIDGQQDVVTLGDVSWEQLSGTPGTVSILHTRNTNFVSGDAVFTSYYDDNSTAPASNCTGDGQAWGTSGRGVVFTDSVCTDPLKSGCKGTPDLRNLQFTRSIYADPANASDTTALNYYNKSIHPLIISVSACQITDGLDNGNGQNDISISPNPSSGRVAISSIVNADLHVYNALGQLVLQTAITDAGNQLEMKDKGVYLFQFTNQSGAIWNKRIVIQ